MPIPASKSPVQLRLESWNRPNISHDELEAKMSAYASRRALMLKQRTQAASNDLARVSLHKAFKDLSAASNAEDKRSLHSAMEAASHRRAQHLRRRTRAAETDLARVQTLKEKLARAGSTSPVVDFALSLHQAAVRRDAYLSSVVAKAARNSDRAAAIRKSQSLSPRRARKAAAQLQAKQDAVAARREARLSAIKAKAAANADRVKEVSTSRKCLDFSEQAKALDARQARAAANHAEYLKTRCLSAAKDLQRVKRVYDSYVHWNCEAEERREEATEYIAGRIHGATIRRSRELESRLKTVCLDADRVAEKELLKPKLALHAEQAGAALTEKLNSASARHAAAIEQRRGYARKDIAKVNEVLALRAAAEPLIPALPVPATTSVPLVVE